ncbi:MAG: hypothetical protein IT423_18140, partial [Pirellulaceae bacterium]|nr:hypothetical protein [Pirellulaceae bacterium]
MLARFLRPRSAPTCRHGKNTRRSLRLEFESREQRTVFAAGELDPSFGIAGQARTEFNDSASWGSMALASAIQSDGKILAAGEGGLVRYTADGTLDASFGDSGRVAFPHYARAMTVQSDGKVLVAGGTDKFNSTDMIVARYLKSGLLDITFDGDGFASIDFGGPGEWATSILVETSGRIVVAGGAGTAIAVARLLDTGAVDTGFATAGKFIRQLTFSATAYALTQQANGRILVAGTAQLSTQFGNVNTDMFVLRLNTNGTNDSSFSGDGFAFVDFVSARVSRDQARGVAVQADGRILVTGSVYGNFSDYAGLARLNVNGSLDDTFGDQGRVRYPLFREIPTGDVLVQSDGRVLMTTHQGIARFQSNGTLDTSWDGDGFLPVSGTIYTGKLQADGSVVVGGNFLQRFGVRRYLSSGAVDLGFAGGGVATTLMGPSNDLANHSVLQADGKIVVVGSSQGGFAVARYLSTGALDTTFSSDGLGVYKFGSDSFEAEATSVAMQSNGQIVVAGWVQERMLGSSSARFAVVRLNSDGSLDTNFSEDGFQTTDLGGASQAQSVVVQNDGKIVVGGRSLGNFATLVRYNTDGSLDRTFSGDGISSMASEGSAISRIVLQPDGRILAAGFQNTPSGRQSRYSTILMMARFNANGSLDSSFGIKGKMVALGTSQRNADDIVLLPDGRFVVVGEASVFTNGSETIHMAVSRFHANGNVDDTFGTRVLTQTEKSSFGDFFIDPMRSWGSSLMRQADGKLVVSGYGDNSLIVVRLRDDGSLDTSFAGDGSFALGSTSDRLRATHVLQQASGELVVTGYARSSTRDSFEHDFLAVRLQNQPVGSSAMSVSLNSLGQIAITDLWSRNDMLQFSRQADSIV